MEWLFNTYKYFSQYQKKKKSRANFILPDSKNVNQNMLRLFRLKNKALYCLFDYSK